jgi:cholesterol oxidase
MQRIGKSIRELRDAYDVVVIGSGYGGAVSASRLARAGRRVCVLERGRELLPGDFPTNTASFVAASQLEHPRGRVGERSALFRFVMDDDCGAAMGCGLGGTSLINAGVALRPDAASWEDERWPSALRADADGLLRESFDRAEAMLRPAPYPPSMQRLKKLDALEAAARSMGSTGRFSRPPLTIAFTGGANAAGIEQPACALCGDCLSGCNTGAKTTLLTTYLPDAAAHGAELFTEIDVRFVVRAGAGYAVHFEPLVLERGRFDAAPMFVRASEVIISAGALGSTEILLRSREEGLAVSRALGRRFSGNATTLAFGYDNAREVQAVGAPSGAIVGPAISGMIDVRAGDRMMIQECSIPRPLAGALGAVLRTTRPERRGIQRLGEAFRALTGEAVERTQCYAVTAQDDSGGRLELEDGRLRLRWPGAGLQPIVGAIHSRISELTSALGGRFVPNPAWENLRSRPPITTHPLGGCCMAEDGSRGVVDDRGRVFDGDGDATHHGLHVCDGSILPGALGYNPLLTISALAERTASLLARERGWTIAHGPAPERRAESEPRPRDVHAGLRFTERMTGYLRLGPHEVPPAPPRARTRRDGFLVRVHAPLGRSRRAPRRSERAREIHRHGGRRGALAPRAPRRRRTLPAPRSAGGRLAPHGASARHRGPRGGDVLPRRLQDHRRRQGQRRVAGHDDALLLALRRARRERRAHRSRRGGGRARRSLPAGLDDAWRLAGSVHRDVCGPDARSLR